MTAKPRDIDQGFALVEALAVLALSGLLLLTMLIAGNLVARSSEIVARRSDEVDQVATGLSAVRRDLNSLLHVAVGTTPEPRILFFGEADRMGLAVGRSRSELGESESLVLLAALSDPRGGSLSRWSRRLTPDTQTFAAGRWGNLVTLISGPWRFRFSYALNDSGGLQWRSSWPDSAKLPTAVRVEIVDQRPGRNPLPPLIVPIRTNAAQTCAGDAASADC